MSDQDALKQLELEYEESPSRVARWVFNRSEKVKGRPSKIPWFARFLARLGRRLKALMDIILEVIEELMLAFNQWAQAVGLYGFGPVK